MLHSGGPCHVRAEHQVAVAEFACEMGIRTATATATSTGTAARAWPSPGLGWARLGDDSLQLCPAFAVGAGAGIGVAERVAERVGALSAPTNTPFGPSAEVAATPRGRVRTINDTSPEAIARAK